MKIKKANDLTGEEAQARTVLLYGESKVGKSLNCIPRSGKTLYIQVEANNPMPELKALGVDVSHVDVLQWGVTNWREFREFMNDTKNLDGYRYCVVDSFTELMGRCFDEIVSETRQATATKKGGLSLGAEVRAEQSDYGAIGQMMIQFFRSLEQYKFTGTNIIFTCKLSVDNYYEYPMIVGQYFKDKLPYFVDLIGRVKERPLDENGKYQLPVVYFHSKDKSFEAGYRGASAEFKYKPQVLDIERIISNSFKKAE
jgi:hypothetical protein